MEHAAPGYSRIRTSTAVIANVAVLVVAAISGLALALRLLYLGKNSFWSDEILSIQRASGDWFEGGTHMVAYHTLLHIWLNLGDSEITIRLLSVIFAVATIPVVYLLGARLFGPAAGVLASLLMAVNAYHVQYSQEARAYSLMILMISLSSYFFVMALERRSRLIWAAYVITSALVVYSHIFGGIALFAQVVSLAFLHWRRVPWKWMLSAWVGILFMLDFAVRQTIGTVLEQVSGGAEETGGGIEWIPAPTMESVRETLIVFAGNGTGAGDQWLLAAYTVPVALAFIVGLAAWASSLKGLAHRSPGCACSRCAGDGAERPSPGTLPLSWKITFLFLWLLLPMLVLLGASLISPVFVPRYTLSSMPALVLVAAAGFTCAIQFFRNRLPPALSAVPMLALGGVLAVILALSARGVQTYYAEFTKEDWRGVTQYVTSQWQPGDGILFYMPWMEPKFRFYLERLDLQLPDSAYIVPEREWRQFIVDGEMGQNPDREAIARFLPDHYDRVWLVLAHYTTRNRPEVLHEIRAALRSEYPDENLSTRGRIRVGIYEKDQELTSEVAR